MFDKLIEKFKNQSLPGLLENILLREGVSGNSVKDVAVIFKETLQFAGILVNGVVTDIFSDLEVFKKTEKDRKENENLVSNLSTFDFLSKKQETVNKFVFTDSGSGWNLTINSDKPLTSEIKKSLIDISDLLKNINTEK